MAVLRRVCVFCGSALGAHAGYREAARKVGRFLAERSVAEGFVRAEHRALIAIRDELAALWSELEAVPSGA
jgi:hypothetical protein